MRRRIVELVRWIVTKAIRKSSRADGGEIAPSKIYVGEAFYVSAAISKTKPLVGKEEEGSIFPVIDLGDPDRTAKGSAEVILRIHASLRTREVVYPAVGVERAVAQEFIAGTVQLVGAGF